MRLTLTGRATLEVALAPNAFRHVRRTTTVADSPSRVVRSSSSSSLSRSVQRSSLHRLKMGLRSASERQAYEDVFFFLSSSRVGDRRLHARSSVSSFRLGPLLPIASAWGLAVVVRAWRDHRRLSSFSREALNPTELQCGDHTRGRKSRWTKS